MKNTNLKLNKTKLVARLMLVILLLTSALTLASCGNQSKGLEVGFDVNRDHMALAFKCAYRSDKTEFNINDVTLTFYYGGFFEYSIDIERRDRFSYPTFELSFYDEESDKRILIRKVEENLVSDKYRAYVTNTNFFTRVISYNHSEEITIPKELFNKDFGIIYFCIYGANVRENAEVRRITSAQISYKKDGDTITLLGETLY